MYYHATRNTYNSYNPQPASHTAHASLHVLHIRSVGVRAEMPATIFLMMVELERRTGHFGWLAV